MLRIQLEQRGGFVQLLIMPLSAEDITAASPPWSVACIREEVATSTLTCARKRRELASTLPSGPKYSEWIAEPGPRVHGTCREPLVRRFEVVCRGAGRVEEIVLPVSVRLVRL